MELARQWRDLEQALPEDWSGVRLALELDEPAGADRAALILAPLMPGRARGGFHLHVRAGRDPAWVLARLDEEGIRGQLTVVDVEEERPREDAAARAVAPTPLASQWDELVGRFPSDWSDVYAELTLDSSDYLERGALLLAPVNPARYGGPQAFRFRVASSRGYGAAPEMTRRCLERLDGEGITGRLRALRVLSRTAHVATQGPVWYVEGRSV